MQFKETDYLNRFNHNEKGNPHPQYENFMAYQTEPVSQAGYIKIFDSDVYFDLSAEAEQDRTLSAISFSALVTDVGSNSVLQSKHLLDINFRPREHTYQTPLAYISFKSMNDTVGPSGHALLLYKKLQDSPQIFNVQIWVYIYPTYASLRFVFLDFYTDTKGQKNRYKVDGSDAYTKAERLQHFIGNNIAGKSVGQESPDTGDYTVVDSRFKDWRSMIYDGSSGNKLTIYPTTEIVLINATTQGKKIDTINFEDTYSDEMDDSRRLLRLEFYSSWTSIVNTGNIDSTGNDYKIVLAQRADAVPTGKGDSLLLEYRRSKKMWFEIARNFPFGA